MYLYRLLILAVTAAVCLACASGPAQQRPPKDVRLSIRHLNKGTTYYTKGCYPKALQHLQEAHERFAAADHLQGTADSLNSMANTYYRLGSFQSALTVYDEAIALFGQLGQKSGQVRALANKSAALIAGQKLDEASVVLDQADEIAGGKNILAALRLKTRAMLGIAHNDFKGAEALLLRALDAAPQADQLLFADIQYTMGHLMLTIRHPERAAAHLEAALKIDRAIGAYYSTALDLAALGSCYDDMARHAEAVGYFKRSLKIFALLQAAPKVQWVLPRLERNAEKSGLNIQAALQWAAQWTAGQREANICR